MPVVGVVTITLFRNPVNLHVEEVKQQAVTRSVNFGNLKTNAA